jgi:hypothetical protein
MPAARNTNRLRFAAKLEWIHPSSSPQGPSTNERAARLLAIILLFACDAPLVSSIHGRSIDKRPFASCVCLPFQTVSEPACVCPLFFFFCCLASSFKREQTSTPRRIERIVVARVGDMCVHARPSRIKSPCLFPQRRHCGPPSVPLFGTLSLACSGASTVLQQAACRERHARSVATVPRTHVLINSRRKTPFPSPTHTATAQLHRYIQE